MFFSLASSAGFMTIGATTGYVEVSALIKTPGLVLELAGVIDSNARTGLNPPDVQTSVFNPEFSRAKVQSIKALVNGHCHTEFSGPAGDVGVARRIVSETSHD